MERKKTTYLVTGGAGFIGTNLVHALCEAGESVSVVDSLVAGSRDRLPEESTFYEKDVRDTEALVSAMKGVDVVVHLAALPRVQFSIDDPVTTHDVNVNGTVSVLEAARKAGVRRVVYAASSSAYGDQETLPLSPHHKASPKSPYALQKLVGEQLMSLYSELYGVETVSLRFFNVYGPHLDPDGPYALVIGKFLKQKLQGKTLTITGDGEQTRDFTHVADVVDAVRRAATRDRVGRGEVLNIGCGAQTSINKLAELIGGPTEYIAPRIEPKHTLADISLTTELLDWRPQIKIEEGVAALRKEFGV